VEVAADVLRKVGKAVMPDADGAHRCPQCDVVVVNTHECTEHWADPDYGTTGFEITRCEVKQGAMHVDIARCAE
jgi:hypothetical protein